MKTKQEFRVLLVYPNLSMLLCPPLALAIFSAILKKAGYVVSLFDVTPYVGEGASAAAQNKSVGNEMNSMRSAALDSHISNRKEHRREDEIEITFQAETTHSALIEMMQARPFSYQDDLKVTPKTGLYQDFVQRVDEFAPDLIITSAVEDTFLQTVKLMSLIQDKGIPSLHGGVFITANPSLAISYPGIDMLGVGEGEQIILDVAERVRTGQSCEDVPGVWVKRSDGSLVSNKRGPLYDFTTTTPDFSIFEDARFYRPMGGRFFKSVPMEAYRGCPYTCAYCNSPMQSTLSIGAGIGDYTRRSPASRVRDHIAAVIDQVQPNFIVWTDDSFLARPSKEIEEFCFMYSEFKIPFWFNTRPENMTADRIRMLKEIGCYRMSFGVECGNEEFREKKLLRKVANKKLIEKFEIIAEGGIPFSVNNVIGFPEETRELIFETIELNRRIPAYDALTVSVFVPYHGTVLRTRAEELGYVSKDSIVCDFFHTTLRMPQLSAQTIDNLLKTFPLYVHFDKSEWPTIRRAEEPDEEGQLLFKQLLARYQQEAFSVDQIQKMERFQIVKGSVGCASNDLDSIRISKQG